MTLSSTYYDSNDTGLGGIANTAGSAVAFLDKVLVNGYNSTTLTSMTQSGTLVTATLNSHGYRDLQWVTISGATPSGYNGTWQIIAGSTTTNTFQFNTTISGMSAATGTLGCIVASLGWGIAFTGTNLRAYRPPSGNRLYLRVDDTGTTTMRTVGYESMTDVNTGTNPFPTSGQSSGGAFFSKSASTAVRTILWGNGSCFWLFGDYGATGSTGTLSFFGDFTSFKSGDVWATMIIGQSTAGNTEGSAQPSIVVGGNTLSTVLAGHFIARSYTAAAGSVTANKLFDFRYGYLTIVGGGAIQIGSSGLFGVMTPYPSAVDGNLWTSQIVVNENSAVTPRGTLVGVLAPLYAKPLTNYTIFNGAGGLAGRTFMAINCGSTGQILAEISNTF